MSRIVELGKKGRAVCVVSIWPLGHYVEREIVMFHPNLPAVLRSNEYSGLISFRIDWFDLAIQGTLKGLLPFQTTV